LKRRDSPGLADLIASTLGLVCIPCKRKGLYTVERLIAKHGNAELAQLRDYLTATCPNRRDYKAPERCHAIFDPLPELRREKPE
jgi:hypothetical protein